MPDTEPTQVVTIAINSMTVCGLVGIANIVSNIVQINVSCAILSLQYCIHTVYIQY